MAMRLSPLARFRPRDVIPLTPQNNEPRTGLSMGQHCQITAKQWQITRQDQDQLALESHQKLAKAYEEGFFEDLLTSFKGLKRDGILRPDTTMEQMAKLKPAFDKTNGTMTAANSTTLTDGASCVLLASEAWESAEFCRHVGMEKPLGSIGRSKLNVKGSSLATGHPFAATGGRIIATLAKLIDQNGGGRGLISICAAGGQGVTAIIGR